MASTGSGGMDDVNLLTHGKTYYHKNLLIRNDVAPVNHDVDKGTLTNGTTEFFLEPRASYTMNELLDYTYTNLRIDTRQYPKKRVSALFLSLLNKYDIDTLLFMVEAAIRAQEYETMANLRAFDDYLPQALSYLEEIKQNREGVDYVLKTRRLLLN